MRITLVLAASPDDPLRRNDPFMPLSLPILAGAAPGHEYTFVDMLAGEEPDISAPVDLVGISTRITAERTAYAMADGFRQRGVKVVLGGPQASSVPLRAAGHADAVAVGEGEVLWPLIVEDASAGALRKFYVASPGDFDAGGATIRKVDGFADLGKTPVPDRRRYRHRYAFDTVYAARGCAIDCDFCSVPSLFGRKTRLRPVADVVGEISGFRGFYYLLDDTVFGRPSTYPYYAELYEALARLPGERLWTGQANLDAASSEEGREVIRRAARSGMVYAAIGMESINPEVQRRSGTIRKSGAMDSPDLVRSMKEAIRFIQEQGIIVSGWFTMGYDEDRPGDFQRTLDFCLETEVIPILCPLEALPGTRLHRRLEAEGRLSEERRVNVVHPVMSDTQVLGLVREMTDRGFAASRILGRTAFCSRFFGRGPTARDRIRARIKRTMFAFVLQWKLRKGVTGLANA